MSRFIQQTHRSAKETKKPRELPKVGKYSAKDLQAQGVKSGLWEKKDA